MTKKKIFISYSDSDRNKMRSVERLIRKTELFSPVIIADNRQVLLQLSDKVKRGIIECEYFIPILTRNSISSQWVNQEIGFATAINRTTIPIVELQLVDQLKGFIHKQLDLSYIFQGNRQNARSESAKFTKIAKLLINDLLVQNNVTPKEVTIESLFPGKWKTVFQTKDGTGSDEQVEIKEGNKYFTKGKHKFNLEHISIDTKKKSIKFKKVGVGSDNRAFSNDIKIIEIGKQYEGFEDKDTKISYYRIE